MNFISEKFIWRKSLLFVVLPAVTFLGKNSFTDSFQRLCWKFQYHFYALCYKEYDSINWRSVNSTTIKYNMFQVISKSIECETDKND